MSDIATAKTALAQPIARLSGVGPAVEKLLARIGVRQIIDLLFYLPMRYEDRTRVQSIGAAQVGQRVVIEGVIELADVVYRGRRALICTISDGTGVMALRFFYFSNAQKNNLSRGSKIRCFGEVRFGSRHKEMIHPEYRLLKDGSAESLETALTPIYPVTEGLQQGRLRQFIGKALKLMRDSQLPDWIPAPLLAELGFPDIDQAVRTVHAPPAKISIEQLNGGCHPCQRRLAFDELLAHHLSLRLLRERLQNDPGPVLQGTGKLTARFYRNLPFKMTAAQQRVIDEILQDMGSSRPMLRLLQGDVGSGKTVVAAAAALRVIECGSQVAVMAPTELLADQHLRSFEEWLGRLGITVVSLTSKMAAKDQREALELIRSGTADIVIGTHALFQERVEFARLALAVVDEQHRFGVHQRLLLKAKGAAGLVPHQLVMTATPIPRTLAMSAYADLDCSVIDELPPGRKPVQTVVMSEQKREAVVARIAAACGQRQQAYWVCPLVGESEVLDCEAAEVTAVNLQNELSGLQVGLIHGQMKPAQKEQAMANFVAGNIDLLVATTVIEVGVDVPNASLMVIENAERMGLAQLHQLRGRIGRGERRSTCVLLYKPPIKGHARKRLEVIRSTTDGFLIAEEDLRLRGPGEVLGTKQTGRLQMRIADVVRDADLLPTVQRAAEMILRSHARNSRPLIDRWIDAQGQYGGV